MHREFSSIIHRLHQRFGLVGHRYQRVALERARYEKLWPGDAEVLDDNPVWVRRNRVHLRKMNGFLEAQKSVKLKRVKQESPGHARKARLPEVLLFSVCLRSNADVAKLADALDLGSSSREGV
jgi:hypothetical protein